ncbi:MAG: 3-deoxy-7-phosphoheptulonate synthase [Candidatus Schekmanbacteria bacterium]|nr:3-deoxy-7-phosphoheptulonate synthase [Candidatus Schekmanbacteria bacterium]
MIIVLRPGITDSERQAIETKVRHLGCAPLLIEGSERAILAVLGKPSFDPEELRPLAGVVQVLRVGRPYKLASREVRPSDSVVRIGGVEIGGERVVVIAGPCAVEGLEMMRETGRRCAELGVSMLRGGAFKPRTSPYSFQGLGEDGLKILAEVSAETGLPVVTEVMSAGAVELVARYVDALQIGARNMQNYDLLKACAQIDKPVVLKRGLAATVDEWLQSAEYVLAEGINRSVILCERGIRTFEPSTRNTLDLNAIPVLRERTHLPILVDPSHGTGVRRYVIPMACAAIAAGAHGILVEAHPDPDNAISDGPQSLDFQELAELLRDLQVISPVVGRALDRETMRPAIRRAHGAPPPAGPVAVATAAATTAPVIDVAFQGEHGAFSEKALHQVFGSAATSLPCPGFRDVFAAVVEGKSRHGIVPIENTLGGSIHINYDLLLEYDVQILAETRLRVVHNLIAAPGVTLADIRRVYAHPQAAAQCEQLLRAHPEWTVYQVYDTAGSVRMVLQEGLRDAAAIAGRAAASEYGGQVLLAGIESHACNYTRFLVIGAPAPPLAAADKTSLVFATCDEPGALLKVLAVFARHRINLVKLESRPIPGKPWEYYFYVDFLGLLGAELCSELEQATTRLKVLGVYPGWAGA